MEFPLIGRLRSEWEWRYSRIAIILVVLLASAYLARNPSRIYLILTLAGLVVLIFLRWPLVGLVTLIIGSFVIPFSIGTGTQTSLNIVVLLVPVLFGLMFLDMLVVKRRIYILPSRTFLPLLAFITVALLSFFVGQLQWFPFASHAPLRAQLGGLAIFVFSAMAFLLTAYQIQKLGWLELLTWIYLLLGAFYILGRLITPFGLSSDLLIQRDATGSLLWVWLVSLSAGLAFFQRDLPRWRRIFLFTLALATLVLGGINRSWASGWIPPLFAFLVLIWLRSWRWGLVITLAMILVVGIFNPGFVSGMIASDQYSIETRLLAWDIVLDMVFHTNPILGLGPANYYYYTPLYQILVWNVRFSSHSQYIDIIAQTGLLGLACFAWFMAAIAGLGWRLRKHVGDGFARGYVYACLAGLAGTILAGFLVDWFLPFVYNLGFSGFRTSVFAWLFLGGLVAIEKIYRGSNPDSSPG
jgi:hypothetical protein